MSQLLVLPLFFHLLLRNLPVDASPYWEFPAAARNTWDQQRMARAQKLITLGRYSERDGDRDMLEGVHGERMSNKLLANGWQQQEPAGELPSIWGFAPNFGTPRAQRDWPSGKQQEAAVRNAMAGGPLLQQSQPNPPKEQQISRPFASAQLPIVLPAPMDGTRAIDRFETNLDRTASGPPAGSSPNRVVLPANFFERLNTGMSVAESIGKNVPKMGTEIASRIVPSQTNAAAGGLEPPKTRILTNDLVPPAVGSRRPPSPIVPVQTTNGAFAGRTGQQPPIIDRPVPALPDFRHEDLRPEEDGERLGPQGKFAGPTNQYREDLGKEFTRSENRQSFPLAEFGPKRLTAGEGPASKFIGNGINPPPAGAQVFVGERPIIDAQSLNLAQPNAAQLGAEGTRGRITPYLNAPEELTGSRWRNIDEHFNALNGGNKGRGPNRFVKMDLLNE